MTSIVKLFGGDTTTEIKSFSAMAEALKNQVPTLMKAVESFTAAGGGLSGMLSGFNTVISSHPIGAAVTAIAAVTIPAAISVFDDYIHKTERLIEAGQKAKQTISETISDYTNKESFVNNSGDRFDELRAGVNQIPIKIFHLQMKNMQSTYLFAMRSKKSIRNSLQATILRELLF